MYFPIIQFFLDIDNYLEIILMCRYHEDINKSFHSQIDNYIFKHII